MRVLVLFLILASVFLFPLHAQTVRVTGTVRNSETSEATPFASVRIEGTAKGTTADKQGRFTFMLPSGKHALTASHIGYTGGRTEVTIGKDPVDVSILLRPTGVELPAFTVTPGDNPAIAIIRQAIESKERRKEKLQNYSLTSHSKVVVDLSKMKGVAINNFRDSNLTAILETQTEAVWAKPDHYKETITARKQTSFIPARSNIMISSFFLIDFSADMLQLSDRMKIVGPISEAGLRNYDYTLKGSTVLDGETMHIIAIRARNDADPLLTGTLYISDGTFALAMVDVELNKAALPSFFKRTAFQQHFRLFDGQFWMPVDVVVDASVEINMLVTVSLKIEGLSVLQDYAINRQMNEDVFDRTRIRILKEADERDSTYWESNSKIPNSASEIAAYKKADSVKARLDSARNEYGFMDVITGKTFSFDERHLTVPGVLSLYRFNRVEGHALYLPLSARRPFDPIRSISIEPGYGIDDREWKFSGSAAVSILESQSVSLSGSIFNRLGNIDEERDFWGAGNTTLASLLVKYDYKDYFLTKGWSIGAHADPLRLFPLSATLSHQTYRDAVKKSDWSIIHPTWKYRDNPRIDPGTITSVEATASFDNRDFIDNAGNLRRFGARNHIPSITVGWNRAELKTESFTFVTASAALNGTFDLGSLGNTKYRISAAFTDGKLPVQRLLNLPGSVNYIAQDRRFRTLDFREFGGDRRAIVFIEHDFSDQLFRWLRLPFLETSGWGLLLFGNAGWTSMTEDTRLLQTVEVRETDTPFFEAGFALERIFLLFRLECAWRLNHWREGRNFFIGISTPFTD
jgi:hypothetical protein